MQDIHSRAWLRTNAWRYPPAVWESIHSDRCNFVLNVDNIEYEYNNYGYRNPQSQEFYYTHRPIAVGCSITFGQGVALTDTWHHLIEHHCNLGQCGASLETVYRTLRHWMPKIKPSTVRLLTPPMGRREVFETDWSAVQYIPQGVIDMPNIFTAETEIQLNQDRMLSAIRWLCRDITLDVITWEQAAEVCTDRGVDGLHPGPQSHRAIADLFCNA